MRKLIISCCIALAAVVAGWMAWEHRQDSAPSNPNNGEIMYVIDEKTPIDKREAEQIPPVERWHELKELQEMTSIEVICHPSSFSITDIDLLQEIADSLQSSKYVAKTDYPKDEPNVKLYFKKKDGFIMAGRFHIKEGVIVSPEGPIIKISEETAEKIIEQSGCSNNSPWAKP